MAANHLVSNGLRHGGEVETAGFLSHACVVDDLKQQITEFVLQVVQVAPGDRISNLVSLLDRVRRYGGEALLLVPRAAMIGITQRRHDVEQAAEFSFGRMVW